MLSNKLKELAATRAKLASLEQSLAGELNRELSSLHSQYGFESVEEFIKAVRAAANGGSTGGGNGRRTASGAAKTAGAAPKKRKRAVVTDETRAGVKKLVTAGKTGGEIAKELGISLPTVQNIKKALGLVRKS